MSRSLHALFGRGGLVPEAVIAVLPHGMWPFAVVCGYSGCQLETLVQSDWTNSATPTCSTVVEKTTAVVSERFWGALAGARSDV